MAGSGLYLLAIVSAVLGWICLQWLRPVSRRVGRDTGEPSIVGQSGLD